MAKKGQKMLQRTQDQKRQLAKAIFNDYAQGMYSLVNCAKAHKVNIRTLNLWCSEDSAVAQFKKNAQDLIAAPDPDALKVKARVSHEKLITGYEYEEKTVDVETDSSGRIKQQKVRKVTKRVQPDTTAVIFTLKNTDPDNFNRGTNDIQTNIITGGDLTIQSLANGISPQVLEIAVKARQEHFAKLREKGDKNNG